VKVSAILKGKPDQFNRYPVVIRINEGERREYKTTPYRLLKSQMVKGVIADPSIAEKVRRMVIDVERSAFDQEKKYPDAEFFTYYKKCLDEWNQTRKYNTLRNYKAEKEKLKGFRSSFKLSQITPQFLTDYSIYLHKRGNIPTTIWTSFKFLRMIVLKARRERLIQENPFDIFKMPTYRDPEKIYLTKEEVQRIEDYLPTAGANKFSATWFLIGCYTGLRYSDMNAFSKEKNIRSGRLIVRTVKTGETVSMPLSKKVKALLESIHYQPMFISNQKFNSAVAKIMEKAEIPGKITIHTARHTFGTMCADSGISQEVTAKLMGHRSLKSTSIYYKITNKRIDKEVERLWE
jgi:integrase